MTLIDELHLKPFVINVIDNNEERREITAWRHKNLMWKNLFNKER
jgi:hypothetical protein